MATFGDKRLPERFWNKVRVNKRTGCWEWTASLHDTGSGMFSFQGEPKHAHRLAYETLRCPILKGFFCLQDCGRRHCCNPDHMYLTLVSPLRVANGGSYWSGQTHCIHGHRFSPSNTRMHQGRRHCRRCNLEAVRRYNSRKA